MKLIIVVTCALVALAVAAPSERAPVEIERQEITREPDGSYRTYVKTSDGVEHEEIGELKEVANEENKTVKVIVIRGSFTIPDDEGHPHKTTYTADENGFNAEGDSIPKAPEPSRR